MIFHNLVVVPCYLGLQQPDVRRRFAEVPPVTRFRKTRGVPYDELRQLRGELFVVADQGDVCQVRALMVSPHAESRGDAHPHSSACFHDNSLQWFLHDTHRRLVQVHPQNFLLLSPRLLLVMVVDLPHPMRLAGRGRGQRRKICWCSKNGRRNRPPLKMEDLKSEECIEKIALGLFRGPKFGRTCWSFFF